jgi:hypothetical protein
VELPPPAFVSFQDSPGWERTVEMTTLDEPLEALGEQVTEAGTRGLARPDDRAG